MELIAGILKQTGAFRTPTPGIHEFGVTTLNTTLSCVARSDMMTNAVSNRWRETGRLEQEPYLRRPRSVRIDDAFRLFIADDESYCIQVYQKDAIELDETQFAAPLRNPTLEVT